MNKKLIVGGIAVVIGIGLFYGGLKYGEAHASSESPTLQGRGQFAGANGAGRFGQAGGQRGGLNLTAGQILSKTDTSITISLQSGGSKIVYLSPKTLILKSTEGSLADLATGAMVTVQGTTTSDGSLTASFIQIRPAGTFPGANMRATNQ